MKNFILVLLITMIALPVAVAQKNTTGGAGESAKKALTVTEAKLGTDVQEKKLVGEATSFDLNQKVYLWIGISGGPADGLTVTWKHESHSYETTLKVGGPTWHTWAYKTAAMAGAWKVSIADQSGTVLKELEYTVGGSSK
jgi:hypothetical protein